MNLFLIPSKPFSSPTLSCLTKPPKPLKISSTPIPARDITIDFGKHKGQMLGTLPSTYLKWVSKNLRARDYEHWAKLADQTLQDPVYKDRLEWEFAEKILKGDILGHKNDKGSVLELVEMSERFGWDNEDKVGWGKIDFGLLGTSKGGRIPRVGVEKEKSIEKNEKKKGRVEVCEKRRERGERVKLKNEKKVVSFEKGVEEKGEEIGKVEIYSPFPGRESLLKKVFNGRTTRVVQGGSLV